MSTLEFEKEPTWRERLKSEFGIHFSESELGFLEAFIEDEMKKSSSYASCIATEKESVLWSSLIPTIKEKALLEGYEAAKSVYQVKE